MRFVRYALLAIGLLQGQPLLAQQGGPADCNRLDLTSSLLSDTRRSLGRALGITRLPETSGFFRSRSASALACAESVPFLRSWSLPASRATVAIMPLQVAVTTNSAYPRSTNDGAAWHGVGLNLGVAGGVRARWKFLKASLGPEFYYQQNKDFDFPPNTSGVVTRFAHPYHSNMIDYPSRFGSTAFRTFNLGQTYVQAGSDKFAVTFGTENVWVGAAEVYPILLSYTAPGFPHVRIGTQRALQIPFARIEFQVLFASLSESRYFDPVAVNDHHYFTTALLVVQPNLLPGLSLGVARSLHDSLTVQGQGIRFFATRILDNPFGGYNTGNRTGANGIGMLVGRWVHPESRFEAYAEWGREDTPAGWLDVLREPDWTQAYVLGFQKTYVRPQRLTRVYGEMIHLGESAPTRAGRGVYAFYTHSVVTQGHTNKGQLLGAAIGPGSDAQLVGTDFFSAKSRTGFRIQRTRYDDDTYYRTFARRYGESRHDAELTLSATRTQLVGGLEIEGGLALSRRYGRQFIPLPSGESDLVENNVSLHIGAGWQPSW